MERINLPFYYQLGTVLNPLVQTDLTTVTKIRLFLTATAVRLPLRTLLDSVESLKVCRADGEHLLKAVDDMENWFGQAKLPDQFQEPIHPNDFVFQNVVATAVRFEHVLSADLGKLITYYVTQKGIYDTADLIERAEGCLPVDAQNAVGEMVIEELRQAGRCLALDSPTACGFHMMRALEGTLHRYYVSVCHPSSEEPLDSWAAYLSALRKAVGLKDPKGKDPALAPTIKDAAAVNHVARVVALLQQIKDQDRNLIMHPEIVLTEEQASSLFETAKAAIIPMADWLATGAVPLT
jgi:hypothetical protein